MLFVPPNYIDKLKKSKKLK